MPKRLLAKRYALGLTAAIESDGELERAAAALRDVVDIYQQNNELRVVLENPVIAAPTRKLVLDEILGRVGAPDIVRRFVHTLFDRRRISALPEAADSFTRLVDQRMNRITAYVNTAVPLTPEQEDLIRAALSVFTGKTVRIAHRIDPDIIGGIVVRVGGFIIDGSLRARLRRVRRALLEQEHH